MQQLLFDIAQDMPSGTFQGRTYNLEKIRDVSTSDFQERFLLKNQPVVLEGVASAWAATTKWTPQFLADSYGDVVVPFAEGKDWKVSDLPDYSVNAEFGQVSLAELLNGLDRGSGKYLRFYPILQRHPELLEDVQLSTIWEYGALNEQSKKWLNARVYIGGENTSTAIHHAPITNLFIQIFGQKKWDLFPPQYSPFMYPVPSRTTYFGGKVDYRCPDDKKTPLFKYCDRYTTILQPGDILFVPPFWWHAVSNITSTIAISFWWYRFGAFIKDKYCFPQSLLSLFGTPNPILIGLGLQKEDTESTMHIINNALNEKTAPPLNSRPI